MSSSTASALFEQLRQLDESDRIEAKRASAIGKSVMETICALANEPGLSPPSFDSDRHHDQFAATYLFHHFLSEADIAWLGQFRHLGLGEDEQRALIFLRETGRITNSDYRDLNRVDTLTASQRLAHLRDLDLVEQVPRGPATYYVPGERLEPLAEEGEDDLFTRLSTQSGGLSRESGGLSQEPGPLSQESGGLSQESGSLSQESREQLLDELPQALRTELERIGQRSRDPKQIPRLIQALCALRPYGARDLAILLKRRQDYLLRRHVAPLLAEGTLRYRYPHEPDRPDQAYIATEEPS